VRAGAAAGEGEDGLHGTREYTVGMARATPSSFRPSARGIVPIC
jgi:hypothetical protein